MTALPFTPLANIRRGTHIPYLWIFRHCTVVGKICCWESESWG